MLKFEKILIDDPSKRQAVLQILEVLNNESLADSKLILDAVFSFLQHHSFLDFSLAKSYLASIEGV